MTPDRITLDVLQLGELMRALNDCGHLISAAWTAYERANTDDLIVADTLDDLRDRAALARQSTISALLILLDQLRVAIPPEQRAVIDADLRAAIVRITH